MRILTIDLDYPKFLDDLYIQNPGLAGKSYDEQKAIRHDSLFGIAGFYSTNLEKIGCESVAVYPNNLFMQLMWQREHGRTGKWTSCNNQALIELHDFLLSRKNRPFMRFPKTLIRKIFNTEHKLFEILVRQIQYYKPDIILNQSVGLIPDEVFKELPENTRLLVGQVASPLVDMSHYRACNLMISSLPNLVQQFRDNGIQAELHRLGFEPAVLDTINNKEKDIPVSFVGMLSCDHLQRINLLETICSKLPVMIWGIGIEQLSKHSPIHQYYQGTAWGREMYQILKRSKVTINLHSRVSGEYANNLRLYEATGVGTCLVTDQKVNLSELFTEGSEIVAYRSAEECLELVDYYINNSEATTAIAHAGQQRTLREHNYMSRMQELLEIVRPYLN